jgi:hypothetical protein
MAIIRAAEDYTGYCVRMGKTTAWNLTMSAPLLVALGCRLLMSDDGFPAGGIVLLGSPVGLPTFEHSFIHEKNAEMERLAALVQELDMPQLSYHILRVCLAVPRLIHTARSTPPELLKDPVDDLIPLCGVFSSSIYDLTDRGMQQVFLPFAVEGGGCMVLRCILRAAYTAVSLTLRSLALCSLGALPPPPFLSLLCQLM